MKNRRNYYRILQVQPDAPTEIIRASYRTLMRELKKHPDLGGSTWDAEVLNEAYETLSDPERRAAYDEDLFLRYTKQTGAYGKQPITPVFCPICKRPLSRKAKPGELCATCQTPLQSEDPPSAGQSRSRSIARIKKSEQIRYYSAWPGKPEQGRMIDFSPKGMRFICEEKLAAQTVLKISSSLFEASGTVTNSSEEIYDGKKCYAVGICFLAVRFEDSRGTFFSTSA
ncbi:MAG: J domain-containing protein [Acidobacteria bacterium]|nr:J domain-containing protein [Acidobacteriota bacterium]